MTAKQIWLEYYLNFLPFINGVLWPLFSLISVIFITSRMAKNAEIISILNAGVSYQRLLWPFVLSSLFLASLHYYGNHYLIPNSNEIRYEMDTKYLNKNRETGQLNDVHIYFAPESKIHVKSYSKRDSTARLVRLEQFDDYGLSGYLKANRMKLIKAPNTWRLEQIEIRNIARDGSEELVLIAEPIDTVLNIYHSDFIQRKHDKDGMNTPELKEAIAKEKIKGAGNNKLFEFELYRRTAESFTIFILTIIGVSIASRKVRGGIGLHLALGVLLGAIYIFLSKFAFTFTANDYLSPLVGVWLPNIVFSIIAVYLVVKAQK